MAVQATPLATTVASEAIGSTLVPSPREKSQRECNLCSTSVLVLGTFLNRPQLCIKLTVKTDVAVLRRPWQLSMTIAMPQARGEARAL